MPLNLGLGKFAAFVASLFIRWIKAAPQPIVRMLASKKATVCHGPDNERYEMPLIPDDFFEVDDIGLHSNPLFNSLRIMEQVSQKPSRSTFLDDGPEPCPKNAGLFVYNPSTKKSMTLPCRSRTCPACGKGWSRNWQNRLGWNEFFFQDDKALTITSAYDPGYKKFWIALKNFWRNVRMYCHVRPAIINKETGEHRPKLFYKSDPAGNRAWMEHKQKKLQPGGDNYKIIRPYRNIEFFGVVEYNQKHTQPHFHFILRSGYIPQKIIKKCWEKAQRQAHFEQIAFDVRIEKVKTSVKQYFFKYITKQANGKDELPKPENWQGRGVRYSRAFFAAPAPQVQAALQLARQQTTDDYSKFYSLHSRITLISEQMLDVERVHAENVEVVTQAWDPFADMERAGETVIDFYAIQFIPYEPTHFENGPPG